MRPLRKRRRPPIEWVFDDGGRAAAGYKGLAGDCVTRAIAIATEQPYQEVYDELNHAWQLAWADLPVAERPSASARTGLPRWVYDEYLKGRGWVWTPTMGIGTGCRVHLRRDELPAGRIIARVTKHICAVIDGVIHDTHDPSREGQRCVYGLWQPPADG
jgi:hypothetical protein